MELESSTSSFNLHHSFTLPHQQKTSNLKENHPKQGITGTRTNINFLKSLIANIGRKHKPHRGQKGSNTSGGRQNKPWKQNLIDRIKMGNEESSPIDEAIPPKTLMSRNLEGLAEYIKSGQVEKICVMTGAGISTSAGIPDFRSPDTGLYANLARLNLPYAEAVFDISYFRQNPEPFYTLAHELYPGKYRPTITHSFIRLLHDKGLLLKHFTQNIDCLDREAGVPGDKIVEAHGSFARQSCIECGMAYPEEELRRHVHEKTIPRCESCKGLVKPEIVFFGEQLPADFFKSRMLPFESDLIIVMGTSLTVQPFASLPGMVRETTPRVLINKERVGGFGSGYDDVLLIGDCDDGVRRLAEACGWLDELEALWAKTAPRDAAKEAAESEQTTKKDKDEALNDEIDKLTKEVDETLNVSRWLEDRVRNERLPREPPRQEGTSSETASQHESKDGNLNHVFVSAKEGATSSASPVPHGDDDDQTKARPAETVKAEAPQSQPSSRDQSKPSVSERGSE